MASPIQVADMVEEALAKVWTEVHREFGPDESAWTPGQMREYLIRIDAARYDQQVVA
jgi:predicted RNase H-related nuclease YkuK (DUF458 family)